MKWNNDNTNNKLINYGKNTAIEWSGFFSFRLRLRGLVVCY